jgi:hypothetical protein
MPAATALQSEAQSLALTFELHPRQSEVFRSPATEILVGGAAGGGKALPLDEVLPTPSGWVTLRNVRVGDELFGRNGRAIRVVAVGDVLPDSPSYRLVFDDGSVVISHAQHEWLTFSAKELAQLTRLDPEWRARRRASRQRRGTGRREWLADRNARLAKPRAEIPVGTVRETEEIAGAVRTSDGRANFAIPVADSIDMPRSDLPIDPYVLGVWLGDGTTTQAAITSADDEVIQKIRAAGFVVTKRTARYAWGILGLSEKLSGLGLFGFKRIPIAYLRASREQRIELLRGLMDTDGTVNCAGSVEFDTTSPQLAADIHELIVSLGWKAVPREGRAKLYGKDCGPRWRIKWTPTEIVCSLPRKAAKQRLASRRTTRFRYIVACDRVEPHAMRCIEVSAEDGLFLASRNMIPTHNSHVLRAMLIALCVDVPGIQCYLFRRTYPELIASHLEGAGSFYEMLGPWIEGGHARINMSDLDVLFPALGSAIHLRHCQHDPDVYRYQSAEMHVLAIDEVTHFSDAQYRFLRSRVRLGALAVSEKWKAKLPCVLAASNPGGVGHNWVKATWIDPAPPMKVWRAADAEGGMLRQFIPSRLEDNPTLTENDPDYERRLEGLGSPQLVRAMRLGDWTIVSGGALDDLWDEEKHTVQPFTIPKAWRIDRSFDWGSSKPFSVCWWAESNGEDVELDDGRKLHFPAKTLFQITELYGWNGRPNEGCRKIAVEVAREILRIEEETKLKGRVVAGPADSAIFSTESAGSSIADDMGRVGVKWIESEKGPGSRAVGLERVRKMLKASLASPMEEPGLLFFNTCRHSIRTLPTLPRDPKKPDDVDTDAEDHAYDAIRYRVMAPKDQNSVALVKRSWG